MNGLERSLFDVVGNPKKISDELQAFQRNVRYFEDHYAVGKKCRGQWVAIVNETEFAHHKSYRRILKLLRAAEIDTRTAYVQYVETEPQTRILQGAILSLTVGV